MDRREFSGQSALSSRGLGRHLESRIDPSERLAALEKDRAQARVEIREMVERLAETHGATARDVTVAMRSIDNTLGDLLYDRSARCSMKRRISHRPKNLPRLPGRTPALRNATCRRPPSIVDREFRIESVGAHAGQKFALDDVVCAPIVVAAHIQRFGRET